MLAVINLTTVIIYSHKKTMRHNLRALMRSNLQVKINAKEVEAATPPTIALFLITELIHHLELSKKLTQMKSLILPTDKEAT